MKVTDLNGEAIEVTDLPLAIMQADDYRHYQQTGAGAETANAKRRLYWQDMYDKLISLAGGNSEDGVTHEL